MTVPKFEDLMLQRGKNYWKVKIGPNVYLSACEPTTTVEGGRNKITWQGPVFVVRKDTIWFDEAIQHCSTKHSGLELWPSDKDEVSILLDQVQLF